MADPDKALPVPTRKIGIREFRGNFSGFMRQVRHGASFVVTSRDQVIAIVRPPEIPPRRQAGTLRGRIEMAADFDDMPPDLLETSEGRGDLGSSSIRMPCCGGWPMSPGSGRLPGS